MKHRSLVLVLILLWPVSATAGFDTDSEVYASRLVALLRAGSGEPAREQVREVREAREAFLRFDEEYPRSVYADDSRFVYSIIEFMGAALVPPRDMNGARQMIVMMDRMVRQYPAGSLEPGTYSILAGELGEDGLAACFYMPYSCIVAYMEAVLAGAARDYKEAIARYNGLKQCLGPALDERIASEVYIPLYRAYLKSERSADAQSVADEVTQLFPGSRLEAVLK